MTRIRLIILAFTIIIVGLGAYFASLYARGFRFDKKTWHFTPNGILVIKSEPKDAQVYINREFKNNTNLSVSLPPGNYDIEVKKEGYADWYKRLTIEKETVTQAEVTLFKSAPSLSPLTLSGVAAPVISADLSKIAYIDKTGLWVIDIYDLPLGFTKEPKKVTDGNLSGSIYEFSPNASEILLTTTTGSFLLPTGEFTPQAQRANLASKKEQILAQWQEQKQKELTAKLASLPAEVSDLLSRKISSAIFTPDNEKVLYTASASATLAENLIKPLPGASTQKQSRNIEEGKTYVYDIKEDRNFLIEESSSTLYWLPTSRNLLKVEEGKISVMDYDATNRIEVFSGSFQFPYAFPYINASKLLILTNLGGDTSLPNLYSLSIK